MKNRFSGSRYRVVTVVALFFIGAMGVNAGAVAWRLLPDTTTGPPVESVKVENSLLAWFGTQFAPHTSMLTYGDPTAVTVIKATVPEKLPVLAVWFNDDDWSGATFTRGGGVVTDLRSYRDVGGLEFMVRGGTGGEVFSVGLLDDESDGTDRKVQTMVHNRDYLTVTTAWQRVRIPFADFADVGKWWNSKARYEVNAGVDWSRIQDLRFSTAKDANRSVSAGGKQPVKLYFADVRFVNKCDAFSSSRYWKMFSSDAPDTVFDRFETTDPASCWRAAVDPKTELRIGWGTNDRDRTRALRMDYRIAEWGAAQYTFTDAEMVQRNWTNYASMRFDFYSSEPAQTCILMVVDAGSEAWSAPFDTKRGWQEIVVPFERFKRFEWWQPEGAVKNGRLDLERIVSYDFRPGVPGKAGTLMVDNIGLTNNALPGDSLTTLWYNQLGYEAHAAKRFMVADTAEHGCAIFDKQENLVHASKLHAPEPWPVASEQVRCGVFSGVTMPGSYSLVLHESGEKAQVLVKTGIYRKPLYAALKAFYFQRSGIDIVPPFAGAWAHPAGHLDTACVFHQTTGKTGVVDVHGGWYDAGDYGKYMVPAAISVGTMLALYECFPLCISDSATIPESGNRLCDLLDEVRFELEWMQRMQDGDGGVFFKVGPLVWDGFVMPHESRGPRYVIGKSTASSLGFAACMAKAARSYRSHDRSFANGCLRRAADAWVWALQHPDVREPQESGGTGAYGDNSFNDEFFWAASELFAATGKSVYRKYLEGHIGEVPINGAAGWANVANLGYFTLATSRKKAPQLTAAATRSIVLIADSSLQRIEAHPCRLPADQFIWGSNSYMLNYAIMLCYAQMLTKNESYTGGVVDIADYIFGRNPTGYSFVTGFGTKTPMQPHHRIMGADTVSAPYPGFLVGGPNGGMEDATGSDPGVYYPYREPARAYIDRPGSYASNEVAINWNAALVFVLGFLSETLK